MSVRIVTSVCDSSASLKVPELVSHDQALRSLITGAVATRYRDSDEYYNVRVMVPEEQMTSREDVENLPLTCAQGEPLRVRDVARVERAVGPVEIVRED